MFFPGVSSSGVYKTRDCVVKCVDVRGREVERRPRNHKDPSSIPGNGCQLWDFHWPTHSVRVLV